MLYTGKFLVTMGANVSTSNGQMFQYVMENLWTPIDGSGNPMRIDSNGVYPGYRFVRDNLWEKTAGNSAPVVSLPVASSVPVQSCSGDVLAVYNQYKSAPLMASVNESAGVFMASCGGSKLEVPIPSKLLYFIVMLVVGLLVGYGVAWYRFNSGYNSGYNSSDQYPGYNSGYNPGYGNATTSQ